MDFAEVIIGKEDDHINLDAPLPAKQIYLKRDDAAEVIVVFAAYIVLRFFGRA